MQRLIQRVIPSFAFLTLAAFASPAFAQGSTAPASPPSDPPARAPAATPAAPSAADTVPTPERAFVVMETSMGPIVLELDGVKAPLSVANFLRYADRGYYDGTVFHRVIGNFMIQGGGFDETLTQKPTDAPIKNESKNGLVNALGTIAFARTNNPDSATSQFFINVGDNSQLKDQSGNGYAVFGKVVAGMDTVNAIKSVKTGQRTLMARSGERVQPMPSRDVPLETVAITSVRRVSDEDAKARIDALSKPGAKPAGDANTTTTPPPAGGAPRPAPSGAGAPASPGAPPPGR